MGSAAAKETKPGRETEIQGGWEGLAQAVVRQACEDYREARRRLRRCPDSRKACAAVRQLERFFTSRWFRVLTDLDGPSVLRRLKEEKI